MTYEEIQQLQRSYCALHSQGYVPAPLDSKVGFAVETSGLVPINGLRHPPEGDTNGWYIWCGEQMSQRADFFAPLHTMHLVGQLPTVLKFLGLPPGYRFLIAGEYEDVWYDPTLLTV